MRCFESAKFASNTYQMNYLHTTLACIACSAFCTVSSAQDQLLTTESAHIQTHLPALVSVYGETWIADNPDAVTALEECFNKRISYLVEPLSVNDKYPLLSSFPLMNKVNPAITAINYSQFSPETFVPITYNLPFFSDLKQVIRVDGTDYIIVIEPIVTR